MKNMEPDKKSLIIYKESIFNKIKYFFKHLFNRNKEINYTVQMQEKDNVKKIIGNTQKTFKEEVSFRENKQDIDLIKFVRNNIDMLNTMSIEELDKIEKAIERRQNFVNKKIEKLKKDLIIKKKNL